MKTCSKCKVEKELSEFNKSKTREDGLRWSCRSCDKNYSLVNKEYYKQYRKQYYLDNKEKAKQYHLDNKDKIAKINKQWYLDNREKVNEKVRNRKQTDLFFKLKCNIRNSIYIQMKKQGYSKTSKTQQILGCDFETFKAHLEKQFTKGMNWNNQGEWHLDHIYPVSLAKDEAHLIELNHYTNFQPLWAIDNLKKGNKIQEKQLFLI